MSKESGFSGLKNGQRTALEKLHGSGSWMLRFLQGKEAVKISRRLHSWREESDAFHLSFALMSDGLRGEAWRDSLEGRGAIVTPQAERLLCSHDFKPTNNVSTEVVILKGSFFSKNDLTREEIFAEGKKRGWRKPNPELACLLLRMECECGELSELDLERVAVMHEPVEISAYEQCVLSLIWNKEASLRVSGSHFVNGRYYRMGFVFEK